MDIVQAKEQFDYQGLLDELSHAYLNSRDKYPRTLVYAYKLITNWKGESTLTPLKSDSVTTFTQSGNKDQPQDTTIRVTKGKLKHHKSTDVECHICSANHYANEWPNESSWQPNQGPTSNKRSRKKEHGDETNKGNDKSDKEEEK